MLAFKRLAIRFNCKRHALESSRNEPAMLDTGLDREIEPGAISTCLAATDDLSEHESLYLEIVRPSTVLVVCMRYF